MAEWVRADIEFASFYSYRIPGVSPSFAICSPLPSPAAVRLALVDAAIRHTGSVTEGKAIFDLARSVRLEIQPPVRVAVMKFFLKRLKPEKPQRGRRASVLESTGVREYCLPSGPMTVWMETEEPKAIGRAFQWLRRLGTTDSLVSCKLGHGTPDLAICLRSVFDLPLKSENLAQRVVFTLHELKKDAVFEQVDPYAQGRRGDPFEKRVFIPPLVRERVGQNWVLYRREPFSF